MTVDMGVILSVAGTVITVLFGLLGFFVKKAFNDLDNKASKSELEDVKEDIEKNSTAINKIKENYLTKQDFFNEQAKTEKKLDKIMDILMEMKGGGSR